MKKYVALLLALVLALVMASGVWAVSSAGEKEISVSDDVNFSQDIDAETTYVYEARGGGGGGRGRGMGGPGGGGGCNSFPAILALTALIPLTKSRR